MKKIKAIALAIACACTSFAYAEEPMCDLYPSTTYVTAEAGGRFDIVFNMDNTILPSSFQVFIEGPEGVTVAKGKKFLVTYNERLDSEVYITNCVKGEGQYANRFLIIDYVDPEFNNAESEEWYIQPGNGPLFTVTMQVSADMEPGIYNIAITDPIVMTRDEQQFDSPNVDITLVVGTPTINLVDGETYDNKVDFTDVDVTYTRNFEEALWEGLYIPFALHHDDWADVADVAQFVSVTEADGAIKLEFQNVTTGDLEPNTPYIILPKKKGQMVLTSSGTQLCAAPETNGSVSIQAGDNTFTIEGTYSTEVIEEGYTMYDGVFTKIDSAQQINPNRIYLTTTGDTPQTIVILVDGMTTGIFNITADDAESEGYNIFGQRVSDDYKGIIIKKGKKILNR